MLIAVCFLLDCVDRKRVRSILGAAFRVGIIKIYILYAAIIIIARIILWGICLKLLHTFTYTSSCCTHFVCTTFLFFFLCSIFFHCIFERFSIHMIRFTVYCGRYIQRHKCVSAAAALTTYSGNIHGQKSAFWRQKM